MPEKPGALERIRVGGTIIRARDVKFDIHPRELDGRGTGDVADVPVEYGATGGVSFTCIDTEGMNVVKANLFRITQASTLVEHLTGEVTSSIVTSAMCALTAPLDGNWGQDDLLTYPVTSKITEVPSGMYSGSGDPVASIA